MLCMNIAQTYITVMFMNEQRRGRGLCAASVISVAARISLPLEINVVLIRNVIVYI